MRKYVSFLFIGLVLVVLAGCDQSSVSSVPLEDMVLIPAGEFIMGTDSEGANADQKPAHTVYLDAFYIDKHEVTNAEYEEFILSGGYKSKKLWTKKGWNFIQNNQIQAPLKYRQNKISTEPDQPVIGVSWYEADAYAKWARKRLPTEAEWEKAAKGTEGHVYPWGNEIDFSKLNYFPHVTRVLAVGNFPQGASPYGVMDMAGNVWEWTTDWYSESYYGSLPRTNPKGPGNGEYRVLRGGAWDSIRCQLQCTYRYYEKESHQNYTIGFRCAKDPSEK